MYFVRHPSVNASAERKYVAHYPLDRENVENCSCDVRNVMFDEEVAVHLPLDDEKIEHVIKSFILRNTTTKASDIV